MNGRARRAASWIGGWVVLSLVGGLALVRLDIAQRRDAFETDARIAHRMLGQRAAQHDAILQTLGLLGSAAPGGPDRPELRLPALYPQVIAVLRRGPAESWPDPALESAERRSRELRHAVPGRFDAVAGQYELVLAGEPASYALRIDAARAVPWDTWPIARDGPASIGLAHAGATIVLQAGADRASQPAGLTRGFTFAKPLDASSQPFLLHVRRATGPREWPWTSLLAWSLASAVALAAAAGWLRARRARRRAESLLRVGQAARLNAMGELAAGVAHELNQPLAAALAHVQAARRLLDDDPADVGTARDAMATAAAQTRRAADVVARLRRLVESPDPTAARRPVSLRQLATDTLELLEPQLRRHAVRVSVAGPDTTVIADPVALEQVVHNLVGNALQALQDAPQGERSLHLECAEADGRGVLAVRDSGPGIAPDALDRVFEPFWTTRSGGLGLGLSLSESLVQAMGGRIDVRNLVPRGAEFRVALPLARGGAST